MFSDISAKLDKFCVKAEETREMTPCGEKNAGGGINPQYRKYMMFT